MTDRKKSQRLSAVMRDLNLGIGTLVEFLAKHGIQVAEDPNVKIDSDAYELLVQEYGDPGKKRVANEKKTTEKQPATKPTPKVEVEALEEKKTETPILAAPIQDSEIEKPKLDLKLKGKIDLDTEKKTEKPSLFQTEDPKEEKKASKKSAKTKDTPKVLEKPTQTEEGAPAKEKNKETQQEQTAESIAPPTVSETVEAPKVETKPEQEIISQPSVDTTSKEEETPATSEPEPKSVESIVQEVSSEVTQQVLPPNEPIQTAKPAAPQPKVIGKIALTEQPASRHGRRKQFEAVKEEASKEETVVIATEPQPLPNESELQQQPSAAASQEEAEVFRPSVAKLAGATIVGKIDLKTIEEKARRKPEASASPTGALQKRRRRKKVGSSDDASSATPTPQQQYSYGGNSNQGQQRNNQQRDFPRRKKKNTPKPAPQQEITSAQLNEKFKEANARVAAHSQLSKGVKYRKEKRSLREARREEENLRNEEARKTLQVSEFVSVNELAGMMDVSVADVIDACMGLDLMVSINQRLDGEALVLVADEFGYKVEFVGPTLEDELSTQEDRPEDLKDRIPIFTVFGHVDHGKTTLCNKITHREKKEAGGITQSITADIVTLVSGDRLVLVDTPGHEAFTAMRSRGAKIADVAIIVISAVEGIQPQTVEAMNHAANNGVHMVFAINKIDMPDANPKRVLDELANMNYLVTSYGGKYEYEEISARQGLNIDKLLEKVLLEAGTMELKANPSRKADAVVLEATKEKGLGSCVHVIVRNGTLRKGDRIVAGQYFGRVRSLHIPGDSNKKGVDAVEPSMPVMVIGLNGTPQAGDNLLVVDTDKEARDMATKIGKIRRLQEMSARKPISLDEIGRRIAIGNFKELNIIIKADVDGSVEAISDALLKLTTEEIQVNIINKGVGQITETDVSLAESSNSVIVGFQVRPSQEAKRLATERNIDIHLYSVIYDAIEEVRQAMEGMLAPEVKEEILGTAEVREIYHISKVGTIAGSLVREGKILRGSKLRIIRDGIVLYSSELLSLKHFKDEAKEVTMGQECGISVKNYNDLKVGDLIEAYRETEVKRTLA